MNYHPYITRKLNNDIADNEDMAKAVYKAIEKFNSGDWGTVPEEDKSANDSDLQSGSGRVLARYETPNGDIYINLTVSTKEAVLMYVEEY